MADNKETNSKKNEVKAYTDVKEWEKAARREQRRGKLVAASIMGGLLLAFVGAANLVGDEEPTPGPADETPAKTQTLTAKPAP